MASNVVPVLYYDDRSPPARSCLMLMKHLNIVAEFREIDLFKQEHLVKEFLELNPLHTVPVFKDGELILTDSHVILLHIAQKYGSNSNVFPCDYVTRMKVLNLLFFECGTLFRRDSDLMELFHGCVESMIKHEKKIYEAYGFLEKYLEASKFMASENITLADFSIVTTLSTIDLIFPVINKWPRLFAWLNNMKSLPCYEEINQCGLDHLKKSLKDHANFTVLP